MKNTTRSSILKRYYGCTLFFFLLNCTLLAQVKIGENPNAINTASILELESTSRALVLTRVTDVQMQAIKPLDGAIVYNIDQQCVFYFDELVWQNLCTQGAQGGPNTGATIVDNGDNTYTFTDRNGNETVITFDTSGGSALTGDVGSLFFVDTDGTVTENNTELYWDNTNSSLGIGTNTSLNDKLTINGTLGVSSGSETEPSYRFSNDADSGMYRIGENEIGFVTAGNEIMRMDENSLILRTLCAYLIPKSAIKLGKLCSSKSMNTQKIVVKITLPLQNNIFSKIIIIPFLGFFFILPFPLLGH